MSQDIRIWSNANRKRTGTH